MNLDKIILLYIPRNLKCRPEEQKNEIARAKNKEEILKQVPPGVELAITWQQSDPDMSVCRRCKDVIYSINYELVIIFGNDCITQNRPVKLCEPCYEIVK